MNLVFKTLNLVILQFHLRKILGAKCPPKLLNPPEKIGYLAEPYLIFTDRLLDFQVLVLCKTYIVGTLKRWCLLVFC